MATVSLEEKRLQQLKQQLFGKSDSTPVKITPRQLKELNLKTSTITSTVNLGEISLKTDLLKILILSTLAIAIQLSLFFAIQHNILKLF